MPSLKAQSPNSYLRWDVKHGFIEIVPCEDKPIYDKRDGPAPVYPSNFLIHLLVKKNPKKEHTKAHQVFALYHEGMATRDFIKAYDKWEFLEAFEEKPVTTFTNGRTLLPGLPGHSYWAERVREIISSHVEDLGGFDAISEAERSILRRAAVLTIESERLERRFASFPVDHISRNDILLYSAMANTLRRLLDMTGLERRTKSIVPTIDEYLSNHKNDPAPDPVVDIQDPSSLREAAE